MRCSLKLVKAIYQEVDGCICFAVDIWVYLVGSHKRWQAALAHLHGMGCFRCYKPYFPKSPCLILTSIAKKVTFLEWQYFWSKVWTLTFITIYGFILLSSLHHVSSFARKNIAQKFWTMLLKPKADRNFFLCKDILAYTNQNYSRERWLWHTTLNSRACPRFKSSPQQYVGTFTCGGNGPLGLFSSGLFSLIPSLWAGVPTC